MNRLKRIEFGLLKRICLQPAYLANSSIHQLVNLKIDQSSPHNGTDLIRIHRTNALINVQRRFKAKKAGSKGQDDDTDSDRDTDDEEESSDSSSSDEDSEDDGPEIKKIETINNRLDMMLKYGKYILRGYISSRQSISWTHMLTHTF